MLEVFDFWYDYICWGLEVNQNAYITTKRLTLPFYVTISEKGLMMFIIKSHFIIKLLRYEQ